MKVYGDLAIRHEGMTAAECVGRLSAVDAPQWRRNPELESVTSREGQGYYCFDFAPGAGGADVRAARLWLTADRDERSLRVPNIIPNGGDQLSPDEYNAVRDRFVRDVVSKAFEDSRIHLGRTETAIEDVMSPETAQALRDFSSSANKSTGASQPMDRKRWFDFIINCFRHKDPVGPDLLGQWLKEQGWDEWNTRDLRIEFENEMSLLKQFAAGN